MKSIVSFILISISAINLHAQSGIEIYLTKYYPDLNQETECNYCFIPTKEDLIGSPVLTELDIDSFNWENQKISLTDKGLEKVNALSIPLPGLSAALVLNGEIIYGFWFWNTYSSFGCDWVLTYPTEDFILRFGLPSNYGKGNDPRFNDKLAIYVKSRKKMN